MSELPKLDIAAELARLDRERQGFSRMTIDHPYDDDAMRARRRALAERELALKEAEIEARIRDAWWTTSRIFAATAAIGSAIVLAGMALGFLLTLLARH
jgi:hypothetical protein